MGNGRSFRRHMTQQQPQSGTPMILPAPLPIQWMLGTSDMEDGSKAIVLQMVTPAGTNLYFMPPDAADQFAEGLKRQAAQVRSGLIIPSIDADAIVRDLKRNNGSSS